MLTCDLLRWFSVVMLVVLFLSFRFVSILALAHRAASFF